MRPAKLLIFVGKTLQEELEFQERRVHDAKNDTKIREHKLGITIANQEREVKRLTELELRRREELDAKQKEIDEARHQSSVFLAKIDAFAKSEEELRARIQEQNKENPSSLCSLDAFQAEVGVWAEANIPYDTLEPILAHLRREANELLQAIDTYDGMDTEPIQEEVADIALSTMRLGERCGFSLWDAILAKFVVIKARQYSEPDAEGVVEHVRDETTPLMPAWNNVDWATPLNIKVAPDVP